MFLVIGCADRFVTKYQIVMIKRRESRKYLRSRRPAFLMSCSSRVLDRSVETVVQ
jgi:hypothetical protein